MNRTKEYLDIIPIVNFQDFKFKENEPLELTKRRYFKYVLEMNHWNIEKTIEELQIDEGEFWKYIKILNIDYLSFPKEWIEYMLFINGGHVEKTAKIMCIAKGTLYNLFLIYRIDANEYRTKRYTKPVKNELKVIGF